MLMDSEHGHASIPLTRIYSASSRDTTDIAIRKYSLKRAAAVRSFAMLSNIVWDTEPNLIAYQTPPTKSELKTMIANDIPDGESTREKDIDTILGEVIKGWECVTDYLRETLTATELVTHSGLVYRLDKATSAERFHPDGLFAWKKEVNPDSLPTILDILRPTEPMRRTNLVTQDSVAAVADQQGGVDFDEVSVWNGRLSINRRSLYEMVYLDELDFVPGLSHFGDTTEIPALHTHVGLE